jgi:hypothetical protein
MLEKEDYNYKNNYLRYFLISGEKSRITEPIIIECLKHKNLIGRKYVSTLP